MLFISSIECLTSLKGFVKPDINAPKLHPHTINRQTFTDLELYMYSRFSSLINVPTARFIAFIADDKKSSQIGLHSLPGIDLAIWNCEGKLISVKTDQLIFTQHINDHQPIVIAPHRNTLEGTPVGLLFSRQDPKSSNRLFRLF